MISKTSLTELVKRFAWRDVARALDEIPTLLGHRDERGRNWLHLCCSIDLTTHEKLKAPDSIKLATLLLERGINVDEPAFTEGNWHATPLWYAVGRGHNIKLAEFLLKRGCDPNHCLWAAVHNGDFDAMRMLVEFGAEVDASHPDGTPFIGAIKWSRFAAAETLLELGADIDQRDDKGMTALHYMLAKNSAKEHFRMIVAHGARGDIQNRKGQTAAELMNRKRDPDFHDMAARLRTVDHFARVLDFRDASHKTEHARRRTKRRPSAK